MNRKRWTIWVVAVLVAVGTFIGSPAAAQSSRQKDKNLMRNLAIGLGSAAAYKAYKGDWKTGLLLGAGAAYSGKKYEDARKAQSRDSRTVRMYRYKDGKKVGYYNYSRGRQIGSYHKLPPTR